MRGFLPRSGSKFSLRYGILFVTRARLRAPGSFRTATVAGYPLVVVRQNDGGIEDDLRSLPHGQTQVVRACSGQAKSFQCFYHLWTYGIDGRLVGVTLPEGYAGTGFDKADYGLREVRVDGVTGMVFVCLSDETESLREFLGEVLPVSRSMLHPRDSRSFIFIKQRSRPTGSCFSRTILKDITRRCIGSRAAQVPGARQAFQTDGHLPRNGHNYKPFEGARYGGEHANVSLDERREHILPGHKPNSTASHHLFPDLLLVSQTTVLRIDHLIPTRAGTNPHRMARTRN